MSNFRPALLQLLRSWWHAGLLLLLLFTGFALYSMFHGETIPGTSPAGGPPHHLWWMLVWPGMAALIALVPGRQARQAVLLGLGVAFCLIPVLYCANYNSVSEGFIGMGWMGLGAPMFGWPLALGLLGLGLLFWWGRRHVRREDLPTFLPVFAGLVLVLAVAPFYGELIGNISLHWLYALPKAQDIPYTGEVRSDFMKWQGGAVLVQSCLLIDTWVPVVLALFLSGGLLLAQLILRTWAVRAASLTRTFPSVPERTWVQGLIGTGLAWFVGTLIIPNFCDELTDAFASIHQSPLPLYGTKLMVWFPGTAFLICALELTRRLQQAQRVRPFYAILILLWEKAVLVTIATLPTGLRSAPGVLVVELTLNVLVAGLMAVQAWLIWQRYRRGWVEPSSWPCTSSELVHFGGTLGLIGAVSGVFLYEVAMVMAFVSVAQISAMISWGNSVRDPAHPVAFQPDSYYNDATQVRYPTPHLDFWIYSGLPYVALCLLLGLAAALLLSGLEFMRLSLYRFYLGQSCARPTSSGQ